MVDHDIEIVDFFRPNDNTKNLYLTSISGKLQKDEIHERLYTLFSKYGLIYEVQVLESGTDVTAGAGGGAGEGQQEEGDNQEPPSAHHYAFVKFYSATAAAKAKKDLSGRLLIKGNHIRIKYASRKKVAENKPLYITKCMELANHYLGFNGWNSKIISLKEEEVDSAAAAAGVKKLQCLGIVQLEVVGEGLKATGVAQTEHTWNPTDLSSRAQVICTVKKSAYNRALEVAFSKLLLLLLPSGKVHVEVDTTQPDPIHHDMDSDCQDLLKVNELDVEPDLEEEETNPRGGGEGTEKLDDINRQLLLDLMEEN